MFEIFKKKTKTVEAVEVMEKMHTCPLCKNDVDDFIRLSNAYLGLYDKYQCIHSPFTFETLNVFQYSCPACGASDRDRLYALYFKEFFARHDVSRPISLIDFAPSETLASFIKSFPFVKYRSADLYMENVDDKVDLTDMTIYPDNSFDIFICSHLLEHIEDDRKALSELYRILKPSGFGILMVPISTILKKDYEDASVTTPEGRWTHFAQDDHVRIYSKQGFTDKVKNQGFSLLDLGVDYFGEKVFERNGIHKRSVLYVGEKK